MIVLEESWRWLSPIVAERKGSQRLVFLVALMVLAVMFIVLYFVSMESWMSDVGDRFINLVE